MQSWYNSLCTKCRPCRIRPFFLRKILNPKRSDFSVRQGSERREYWRISRTFDAVRRGTSPSASGGRFHFKPGDDLSAVFFAPRWQNTNFLAAFFHIMRVLYVGMIQDVKQGIIPTLTACRQMIKRETVTNSSSFASESDLTGAL